MTNLTARIICLFKIIHNLNYLNSWICELLQAKKDDNNQLLTSRSSAGRDWRYFTYVACFYSTITKTLCQQIPQSWKFTVTNYTGNNLFHVNSLSLVTSIHQQNSKKKLSGCNGKKYKMLYRMETPLNGCVLRHNGLLNDITEGRLKGKPTRESRLQMLHDLIEDDGYAAFKWTAEKRKELRYRESCQNLLQSRRLTNKRVQ